MRKQAQNVNDVPIITQTPKKQNGELHWDLIMLSLGMTSRASWAWLLQPAGSVPVSRGLLWSHDCEAVKGTGRVLSPF